MSTHEFNVTKNVDTVFSLTISDFTGAGGSGHVARINDVATMTVGAPASATTYPASTIPIAVVSSMVCTPTIHIGGEYTISDIPTTADDCCISIHDSFFSNDGYDLKSGGSAGQQHKDWIPFVVPDIATGATIQYAGLTVYPADDYGGYYAIKISCDSSSANVVTPTSYLELGARPSTAQHDHYDDEDGWVEGDPIEIECTNAIQGAINNPNWIAGNTLAIIIYTMTDCEEERHIRAYDYDGGAEGALLTIEYFEP